MTKSRIARMRLVASSSDMRLTPKEANTSPQTHTSSTLEGERAFTTSWKMFHLASHARAVSGGFWVSTYGRRFQVPEMCILQGMPADRLAYTGIIPESAFRKIIGNAFSLNVMERILVRTLNATHLLPQKLLDRWEGNMKAVLKAFRSTGLPAKTATTWHA